MIWIARSPKRVLDSVQILKPPPIKKGAFAKKLPFCNPAKAVRIPWRFFSFRFHKPETVQSRLK